MAMKSPSRLLNSGVCLQSFCRSPWRLQGGGCRTLFTTEALAGIDQYSKQRNPVEIQVAGMADKFRAKMNEFTTSDPKNMASTEDLKNILHLVDNTPEDMTLVYQMMKRFNQQNKHIQLDNLVFGPVLMRMYHHLNQPVQALEAFKDPELEGMFNNQTTAQILCDLLYRNKMYNEVLEVFEAVQTSQAPAQTNSKNATILAFASCVKLLRTDPQFRFVRKQIRTMKNISDYYKKFERKGRKDRLTSEISSLNVPNPLILTPKVIDETYGRKRNKISVLQSVFPNKTKEDIHKRLRSHRYWFSVPVTTVLTNLNFLSNEKNINNEYIYAALPILLYPLDKLKQGWATTIESGEARIQDSWFLNMVLYFLEKPHHFTGDGIWHKPHEENERVNVEKTIENTVSNYGDCAQGFVECMGVTVR